MSSWMYAIPLSALVAEGGWEWLAAQPGAHRVPAQEPSPQPLPKAADVVAALRSSGCGGIPWFTIDGPGNAAGQSPALAPADHNGLSLGEVTLSVAGNNSTLTGAGGNRTLAPDSEIAMVGFRKPHCAAVLRASCALAAAVGAVLVFHDSNACQLLVVSPQDSPDSLAPHWLW